jgi:hypothetical protein
VLDARFEGVLVLEHLHVRLAVKEMEPGFHAGLAARTSPETGSRRAGEVGLFMMRCVVAAQDHLMKKA